MREIRKVISLIKRSFANLFFIFPRSLLLNQYIKSISFSDTLNFQYETISQTPPEGRLSQTGLLHSQQISVTQLFKLFREQKIIACSLICTLKRFEELTGTEHAWTDQCIVAKENFFLTEYGRFVLMAGLNGFITREP